MESSEKGKEANKKDRWRNTARRGNEEEETECMLKTVEEDRDRVGDRGRKRERLKRKKEAPGDRVSLYVINVTVSGWQQG